MIRTQDYIERSCQNVYGSKKLKLPKPELYVIYTGDRKTKPEYLYLSKDFFDGEESAIEVKVRMIYDGKEGDSIERIAKIFDIPVREVEEWFKGCTIGNIEAD